MGNAIQFTDDNFASEVLESDQPVVVDFWAEWCGPCRALGPTIEELAEDYEGVAKVGKMNIDDNKTTATNYRISSIPSVLVFHKGQVVQTLMGIQPKEKYAASTLR